jgi:hypothetical protein
MSLVWFGDASRRSGRTASLAKASTAPRACRQSLLWWLTLWLLQHLLQSCIRLQRVRLRRPRGRSERRRRVRRENWTQRGLQVQVVYRSGMGPVISATYGNSSGSFYAIADLKDWLLSQGLPSDEPVLEWLWALEERDGSD